MVLKKNKLDNNILFIDASSEFVKNPDKMKNGKNSNKLSDDNIKNIVSLYKKRDNKENKSVVVSYDVVKNNDYNISVSSYLKTNDDVNPIDINDINRKLSQVVPRQEKIREELEEIIKELEGDYYE